jgi:hypothetical protein
MEFACARTRAYWSGNPWCEPCRVVLHVASPSVCNMQQQSIRRGLRALARSQQRPLSSKLSRNLQMLSTRIVLHVAFLGVQHATRERGWRGSDHRAKSYGAISAVCVGRPTTSAASADRIAASRYAVPQLQRHSRRASLSASRSGLDRREDDVIRIRRVDAEFGLPQAEGRAEVLRHRAHVPDRRALSLQIRVVIGSATKRLSTSWVSFS